MKGRTAARRYAKALIDLARRDKMVAEIGEQLRQHWALLQDNANLRRILENPSVDLRVRTAILTTILERTQPTSLLQNFLLLLVEKDRIQQLALIWNHYERMANEQLRRVVAQVTTAVALNAQQRRTVTRKLTQMTQKEVTLQIQVDPAILGGLLIRIENTILDGSLRGHLARMQKVLIGG